MAEKSDKIKIYYDYQILTEQKYGGISRYYYEIIKVLEEKGLADVKIRCFFSINKYFEDYFGKKACEPMSLLKHLFAHAVNRIAALLDMQKGYDIIHPTYYFPYVTWNKKGKIVITVYDMIHEIFPEMFLTDKKTVEQKKKMIYKADHIIAISESTKRDILKFYPDIPEDKITVIYIGSSIKKKNLPSSAELPEKYILFVGTRSTYKNFKKFVEAVIPLLEEDEQLKVVCIGGGPFKDYETEFIGKYQDSFLQFNADDSTLECAYSNARCFVFPSLYEGFGIPTLEAFACDCPAVISNTSSMPEVGGDAVVYFDPYSADNMREAIKSVITSEQLQEQLIVAGRERLKLFDWEKIVNRILDCYKKVVNNN